MDSLVGWNDELALAVEKPEAGEQVTVAPVEGQGLDLSAIAALNAQFYQTGSDLWLVFEDGAIVVVEGYFEGSTETADGTPRSVIVDGETFTGEEFMTAFAIDELPDEFAEGETGDSGPQQNSATFDDPSLGDLGPNGQGLGLLGNTNLSRDGAGFDDEGGNQDTDPTLGLADIGAVDDDDLVTDGQSVFIGSLAVDFGNNDDDTPDSADLQDTPTGFGDRSITFDSADVGSAVPLTSGGTPLTFTLSNGGTVLTASAGGTTVFEVRLFDDGAGSYRFTLLEPLDHPDATSEDDLGLTFSFTATDDDGDSVSGTFTVNVNDDVPEVGESENVLVDEDVLVSSVSSGTVDANLVGSAGFVGGINGSPVTFAGGTGTGIQVDPATGNWIYQVLNGTDEGLTFELRDSSGTVLASGTVAAETRLFIALDGADVAGQTVRLFTSTDGGSTFSDNGSDTFPGLGAETQDFDNWVGGALSNESGDLGIDWGADDANTDVDGGASDGNGDRAVNFTDTSDAGANITVNGGNILAADLTSRGDAITYSFDNDSGTLIATADAGGPNERVVFTVALSDDGSGSYDFSLQDVLDHPDPTSEDDLELTFDFTATDSDGDTDTGDFTVNVNDDVPEAEGAQAFTVDEDRLPEGTDANANRTSGTRDLGIAWGADDDIVENDTDTVGRKLAFVGEDGLPITAPASNVVLQATATYRGVELTDALTSDGVAILFDVQEGPNGGQILIAYKEGGDPANPDDQVARITLDPTSDTGSYTFELLGNFDHPDEDGVTSEFEPLVFEIDFAATDSDGDEVQDSFVVRVQDDQPEGQNPQNVSFDEDRVAPDGNDFDPGQPLSKTEKTASLRIDWGADNDTVSGPGDTVGRTLAFVDGAGEPVAAGTFSQSDLDLRVVFRGGGTAPSELSSNGIPLQFVIETTDTGGQILTAYRGDPANGEKVFVVELDPTTDSGSYTVTLLDNIDHADPDSGSNRNAVEIEVGFQAFDADGDALKGRVDDPHDFKITIFDDEPEVDVQLNGRSLVYDETPGNQTPEEDRADPLPDTLQSFISASGGLSVIAAGKDDLVNVSGSFDIGADGTVTALTVTLTNSQGDAFTGEDSGLVDTATGSQIFLFTEVVNGEEIVVGRLGDGAGNPVDDGQPAFALDIEDGDGNVTIAQFRAIEHDDENDPNDSVDIDGLHVTIEVTDGDGDTVRDTSDDAVTVRILDDAPVVDSSNNRRIIIDDDDVVGANGNPGFGDDPTDGADSDARPRRTTGTLDHEFGADGGGTIAWVPGDVTTSGGAADLRFETNSDGSLLIIQEQDGSDVTVATITLNPDTGEYTVTQNAPLMHRDDANNRENNQNFELAYRVTDGDGDTADGVISLRIDDDTPVVTNPGGSAPGVSNAIVDEDDVLATGDQPAGTDGVVSDQRVATGTLKVNFGADGFGSTAFSGAFAVPNENSDTLVPGGAGIDSGLTSDGRPIFFVLSADGQTLSGVTPGGPGQPRETIFTAELNDSDAGYTVTLLGNIDHQAPDGVPGGRDEGQSINLTVVATDGDDDTLDLTLSIRIRDDAPVVTWTASERTNNFRIISDDDTVPGFDGNPGGVGDSAEFHQSGKTLPISFGADGGEVTWNIATSEGLTGIEGGPASISFEVQAHPTDANKTILLIKQEQGDPAVTVTVAEATLDKLTGAYSYEQVANLLHEDGNDENDATFNLGFTVTDGDGDTVEDSIPLIIDDDTPVVDATPSANFFDQDFETATGAESAGFVDGTNGWEGSVEVFASGTGGIVTQDGGQYALVQQSNDADPTGPFTRFDGYKTEFNGGFVASVDIYLDPSALNAGEGFDYSVAANGQDGNHQRDFIFHVTKDTSTGELLIGGSNNTNFDPKENLETGNHVEVTDSGWYTFEHVFRDAGDGTLAVDLNVYDSSGTLIFTETRNDPSDLLLSEVGGNRYGWFTNIDVPGGIAIDNVKLRPADGVGLVDEDDLPAGSDDAKEGLVVTGDLAVAWGADNADNDALAGAPGDRTLTFDAALDGATAPFTVDGNPVIYTLSADGTVLTASSGATDVFTVELNDDDSGSYTFTLLSAFDHSLAGEDIATLDFDFVAKDSDGDTATGSFSVAVKDDVPDARWAQSHIEVDEATDVNNAVAGQLQFTPGADGASVTVAVVDTKGGVVQRFDQENPAGSQIGDLLVGGNTVITDAVTDPITGVITITGTVQDGADTPAFEIIVQPDGSYTYTQLVGFDHPDAGESGADDKIALRIDFTVTDSDGDTDQAGAYIRISDDAPMVAGVIEDEVVEDATGPAGAQVFVPDTASGSLVIDWGADDGSARSVVFDPSLDGLLLALTSAGEQLSYSLSPDGTVLTAATAGGRDVFTIELSNANAGEYTVTLLDSVDHDASRGNDDEFFLPFNLVVTDSDGDTTNAQLRVTFKDDEPVVADAAVSVTVDEDDIDNLLSEGSEPFDGDSVDGSLSIPALLGLGFAAAAEGSALDAVDFGADGPAAGSVFSFTSTATSDMEALELTSKGSDLSYEVVGDFLLAYVDRRGGAEFNPLLGDRPVFSIELDGSTGEFIFRQYDQLDHVDGNGENTQILSGTGSIDAIDLGAVIDATVTDGDGDTVTLNLAGKVLVTVTDDVPVVDLYLDGSRALVDESPGRQGDDTNRASVRNLFNGVQDQGSDADFNVPQANFGSPQYARDDVVDWDIVGTDEPRNSALPVSVVVSLSITDSASGLKTTIGGYDITLFEENGLIVGRYDDGSGTPKAAFAVHIDDDGRISIAQYVALEHDDPTRTDESIGLDGKVGAVLTVTDHDGDEVVETLAIGERIRFDDDAPDAEDDSVTTNEDEAVTIVVLGNDDTSADGVDPATGVAIESDPSNGTVVVNDDGTITYTPNPDYNGSDSFEYTITDGDGDTSTATVDITVDPVNDAPVINLGTSDVSGSVNEPGSLPNIIDANAGGDLEPIFPSNATVNTALVDLETSPGNVPTALATIQTELSVDLSTAIAIVWDHLDDAYVSAGPNQTNINQAFVRLGVEYADYLEDGGTPLLEVVAKFTPDDGDANLTPERLQSLHDNLLGNLSEAALTSRFNSGPGADPVLFGELRDLVFDANPNLLTRDYYSGNEGTSDADARQFDVDNSYEPIASGQLFADDVDVGDTQTWNAASPNGTYGTFSVDSNTGEWAYVLDSDRPATQALEDGETPVETFAVTVEDAAGAQDIATVSVTVNGSADTPVGVNMLIVDSTGVLGSFTTIQAAVNAASPDDVIFIVGRTGAYDENVVVDKSLSFKSIDVGEGGAVIAPTSGTAVFLDGTDFGGGDVKFDGIDLVGTSNALIGIDVEQGSNVGTLSFINGTISGFDSRGIWATDNGDPLGTPTMANLVILNVAFSDNGTGSGNTAHVKLFGYSGDASFENVSFAGTTGVAGPAGRPDNAVEIVGGLNSPGSANPVPANEPDIGTVVFNMVTVTGEYHKNPIAFFNFAEIDGLSIADLDLSGAESNWGPLFNIDGVADLVIDASGFGILFPATSDIHTNIQGDKDGQPDDGQEITGTDANDFLRGRGGDDTLEGGIGNDFLVGDDLAPDPSSDGVDTAVFNGVLDASDITTVADVLSTAGAQPGWQVDATAFGEGTDTLFGVEIVQAADPDGAGGSTGRFLLVGSGGFATIQEAVDAANEGDTILIAPGTYTENVVVTTANLTILGVKAGVAGDDGARGTGESSLTGMLRFAPGSNGSTVNGLQILQGGTAVGALAAVYIQADNITVTNMLMERTGDFENSRGVVTATGDAQGLDVSASKIAGFATGIFINPGSDAKINGNVLEGNNVGLSNDGPDASDISGNSFIDNVLEQIGIGVLNPGATDVGGFVNGNTFTGSAPEVSIYDLNAGNQTIIGTDADDVIWGGAGVDTLTGAAGVDTFIIRDLSDVDIITDYTQGEDKIDLTALLAGVTLTEANKNDYVRVQGGVLQVDTDGAANGVSFVDAATLNGVGAGVDVTILDDTDTTAVELSITSI